MDAAHLHLILNHLPIIGLLFGGLLLIAGVVMKSKPITNAGLISLVIAGLLVLPAFFTGEDAEHYLEKVVPTVEHSVIHEHEEAAEFSLWVTLVVAFSALGTLIINRKKEMVFLPWIVIMFTGIAFASLSQVAMLGGEIRHTEIRRGMTDTTNSPSVQEDDKE